MAKRLHETTETHSFRRFFETTVIKEGLSPLYVNILMNHEIGLEKSYFKPTISDLLEGSDKMTGYLGIMEALTINEEYRLSKQVQTLQEKNHDKDYIIQGKLSEKDEQIKALQESIKFLSDTVSRTLLADPANKIITKDDDRQNGRGIKGIEIKSELNNKAVGKVISKK